MHCMKWNKMEFATESQTSVHSSRLHHKVSHFRIHEPVGQFHTPPQCGEEPSSVPMSRLKASFMMDALMISLKKYCREKRNGICVDLDATRTPQSPILLLKVSIFSAFVFTYEIGLN